MSVEIDLVRALDESLRLLFTDPGHRGICVGFSGGPDSLALVHALVKVRTRRTSFSLRAAHVNHGLSPNADEWENQCATVCRQLDLSLEVRAVDVTSRGGASPEEAAREARYGALSSMLGEGEVLCTAHHRDDQCETLLLQLLRGSGPRGLAAMPGWRQLGAGWHWRPLLDTPRSALVEYLIENRLSPVFDETNASLAVDRIFLRHDILPRLRRRWPGADQALARAVAHQAQANRLLDALADAEMGKVRAAGTEQLDCAALRALGPDLASLVLRCWLREKNLPTPTQRQLRRVIDELIEPPGAGPRLVAWTGVELRTYRGRLYALTPCAGVVAPSPMRWDPSQPLELAHGRLVASSARGRGVAIPQSGKLVFEVRFRRGGERCRPVGRARTQSLKRLYQDWAVPPWERPGMPLIFLDGCLVAVAGLWVCEGYQARPLDRGLSIEWHRSIEESRGQIP